MNYLNPIRFLIPIVVVTVAFVGCQNRDSAKTSEDGNAGVAGSSSVTDESVTDESESTAASGKRKVIAEKAKDALFARLSGRLMEVMQSDGPVAAINVCSNEAVSIAESVGKEYGVEIGRTSFKLRNPANTPREWVKPFVEKRADTPQFTHLDDGSLGAIYPIRMSVKCLMCHGGEDDVLDAVKPELAKRYPDDAATGFKLDDLRGWFWVEVPSEVTQLTSVTSDSSWSPLPTQAAEPGDTEVLVQLGKKLYFDPRLSLTGTVSCNSCHNLMEGGDDGRPTSMGIHGRLGPRNAPTVWNSVFQHSQFWDGRAATLEEQSIGPIVAAPEMGMPSHDVAIKRLSLIEGYVQEFAAVFGNANAVTIDNVGKAIAAFERTLITPNSAYDRFVNGDPSALTSQQLRGMESFDSVGCTECHSGSNFNGWTGKSSDMVYEDFPRNLDSPLVKRYSLDQDLGRSGATNDDADEHRFKIALLRNITLTGPYFHNGAVDTLPEAVRVMALTQLDEELSDTDVADIVSFMSALEGEFPEIVLPRLPSRSGKSILEGQTAASDVGKAETKNF